ncbi:hypothetical protein GGF50DRAFT_129783 [Schizophyllum commune]
MVRRLFDALYSALERIYVLRQLSYALHGFLVGLHLALGILHLLPLEQSITFSLSPDDDPSDTSLAVAMTMSGTIFATLYGSLLIWITQKLALMRLLTSRQTLTAMHDEYNSWIGIGSAMLALAGQRRIRSALPWVSCITAYLVCITALHSTVPSMVTVKIGEVDFEDYVTTRLAYPDVKGMLYSGASSSDTAPNLYHALFTDASSLLPYIALLNGDQEPGLARSTIYDITMPEAGMRQSNSTTLVNSTTFSVKCGKLESLELEDYYPKDAREVRHYDLSHVYPNGAKQDGLRIYNMQPNNAMAFAWLNSSTDADARPAYNRSFYLYGTFNVMDSAGVWLPNLTLPQRVAAGAPVNISVVGCNLYSNDSFVHVNTTTRLAVREEVANMSTSIRKSVCSAHWESYEPQGAVKAEELDILDLWTPAISKQYETNFSLGRSETHKLGFMAKYLTARLGLRLPSYSGAYVPRQRVHLYELENALSELVASYFWALNQVNTNDQYGIERTSVTTTLVPMPVRKFRLNRLSIFSGLIISLALLFMNYLLVRPRAARAKHAVDILDSLGLLQTVWFLRDRPDVLSTVGRVENPVEDDLRLAGMFVLEPDLRGSVCVRQSEFVGGGEAPIPLVLMPAEPDQWREGEVGWYGMGAAKLDADSTPSHWQAFDRQG